MLLLPELLSSLRGISVVPALLGLLAVYFCISYITAWYKLRHFPGPRLASFSYLYMLRVCLRHRQAQSYYDISKKYGGHLVRIGPNDLITDDPELIRRMSAARSTYRRSNWYSAMRMDPYDDGLFSMTDTAAHDKLKARLSFGYGGKENPSLEEGIDEQLKNLVDLIRRKYISTDMELKPMDFAKTAQFFTLDAVTKIAYGKEFGYLATDSDVYAYIETAEAHVPYLVVLGEVPFLWNLVKHPWVLNAIGPKKTDKKGMGTILGVAERVISERFGPDAEDRKDMLGAFMRHGVTRKQCQTEIPFQIIAGSDTTATAIRGTMLYLATTRQAYDRLQQEIDTAITEGRISSPIRADEGKKLEYLQAVIYEGMRMQLPFSGLIMKESPPEGDTYNGTFIPGGTRIAQNTLAIQRSTEIFGPDAELFRPERWLNIEPEKHAVMTGTVELVFGYGRWGCAGKPVAFIELNKVYVELLRYFDFQIVYPTSPMTTTNSNMFFQSDMWVKITERVPPTTH